jgi:predicted N-formylglutamate amidohydrolase
VNSRATFSVHREAVDREAAIPYFEHNAGGRAPILVVCDHATRRIPADLGHLGLDDWVLDTHVAWDIGAAAVACRLASELDAPAILSGFSRLVVDPNRGLGQPEAFPAISAGIAIPGNRDLSEDERERRAERFWRPYHRAIDTRLKTFADAGVTPAFISIHTCTPVYDRVVRPWHIGVLWDKDPRLAVPLMEALSDWGDIHVGDNEPYSGRHPFDFTVDNHAEAAGLPCVAVELRQNLVDDEAGADYWAGMLARSLAPALAREDLYRPLSGAH